MSARGLNLLVFREGSRRLRGLELKAQILKALKSLDTGSSSDDLMGSLLRAGELECGIADAATSEGTDSLPFAQLTNCLAEALLSGELPNHLQASQEAVRRTPMPEWLNLSKPEGFAYYALHPLNFAKVLDKLPALPERIVVIGIRSIGTTLSAVTAAAARLRGLNVVRMTVRPVGHPYNRQTEFSPRQRAIIQNAIACGASFLIVDEGPGLSGSSFLSVAETLQRMGVATIQNAIACGASFLIV